DEEPHTMEGGDNGCELHDGAPGQIEVVAPVAQGKAAWLLAKSEEKPGSVRAGTDRFDNILAVPVELKVQVGCRDGALAQRDAGLVLYCEFKKQFWRSRLLRVCRPGSG